MKLLQRHHHQLTLNRREHWTVIMSNRAYRPTAQSPCGSTNSLNQRQFGWYQCESTTATSNNQQHPVALYERLTSSACANPSIRNNACCVDRNRFVGASDSVDWPHLLQLQSNFCSLPSVHICWRHEYVCLFLGLRQPRLHPRARPVSNDLGGKGLLWHLFGGSPISTIMNQSELLPIFDLVRRYIDPWLPELPPPAIRSHVGWDFSISIRSICVCVREVAHRSSDRYALRLYSV